MHNWINQNTIFMDYPSRLIPFSKVIFEMYICKDISKNISKNESTLPGYQLLFLSESLVVGKMKHCVNIPIV